MGFSGANAAPQQQYQLFGEGNLAMYFILQLCR